MAERQNSSTDTARTDRSQFPALSAVPNSKDLQFPSSSGGAVNLQQGDGKETAVHSDVEKNPYTEFGDNVGHRNWQAADCVQEDFISHLKDNENILDTARLNTKQNDTHSGKLDGEQKEETGKQGCPIWQILEHLECPFNWVPDICIKNTPGGTVQENMIDHLTGKEKEFSQVKSSIFREVAIYLVLAYEKTLEDNLMDAITDLGHCYDLLDNPEVLTLCDETRNELDLTLVRGKYHFSEMKRKRGCLLHVVDEIATDKHLPLKDGDDESEVINRTELPRHSAREKSRSCDAKLNGTHKLVTVPEYEGSKKINQNALNNDNLLADIMQETECDKTTKDTENERPVREDNKPVKQAQRIAAIEYVINATLAYAAYFSENSQEAYRLAKCTEHTYDRLGSAGKATVAALRGAMLLEYGYTGNKLGLQFLQKALELDPDYWEWNLYCGKIMGRVRRAETFTGVEPGQEELRLLEKAVQLNPEDASALVQLGNTYRALSHFRYKEKLEANAKPESVIATRHYVRCGGASRWKENWLQSRCSQQQEESGPLKSLFSPQHTALPCADDPFATEDKKYLESAKQLFLKALQIAPNCPYTNARCAKALWAMPVPYKDKKRAEEAIVHACNLAPNNSFVNHYAATFYEYVNNYEKSLNYYDLAIRQPTLNYPAEINYINLKMRVSPPGSYSPVFHLSKMLSQYRSRHHAVQTHCHRGFYLYKVEKDYLHAIQDIYRAIRIDPGCQTLKTFYPGNFYGQDNTYNMYDLLEEMAAEYRQLPQGQAHSVFVEATVKAIRELKN